MREKDQICQSTKGIRITYLFCCSWQGFSNPFLHEGSFCTERNYLQDGTWSTPQSTSSGPIEHETKGSHDRILACLILGHCWWQDITSIDSLECGDKGAGLWWNGQGGFQSRAQQVKGRYYRSWNHCHCQSLVLSLHMGPGTVENGGIRSCQQAGTVTSM